jgi:4'-phosphopantetheinyl transferase
MVACAIAPGADIGVDGERVDRPLDEDALATRFFAAVEQAHLRRCAPAQRAIGFFELWTLKEAYLKAIGVGLSHSLSEMAFELDDGHGIAFVPPPGIDSRSWQFALFEPAPRFRLAVAVRRTRGEPWRITATVTTSGHEASVAAIRASVG